VRSKLHILVRRNLQNYKYPPNRAAAAVDLILKPAEMLANDWAVYFRTIRGIYMNSFTALIFLVIINGIFTFTIGYEYTPVILAVSTIFYCYYTWVRNENKLFWIEPTLLPSFGFIFLLIVSYITDTSSLITSVNMSCLALAALSIGLFNNLYRANLYIDNQKMVSCFNDWIPKSKPDVTTSSESISSEKSYSFHQLKGLMCDDNFVGAVTKLVLKNGDIIEINIDKNLNLSELTKNSVRSNSIALRNVIPEQKR